MKLSKIFIGAHFCLVICASFFMLSVLSCSVRGTDIEEQFVIEFLPKLTSNFRKYCIDSVKNGIPKAKLREGLFKFAKEGESSAAHTLWRSYQSKSLQELEVELRKFASAKNPYACNLLASCLANQRKPECLEWYQIYDLNFTGEDSDFRGNYASAILCLKQPLNVEALKDTWRLLRIWREIDKTNSDNTLEGLYLRLTKAAIEIKAKEFICDLYTWAHTHDDSIIHRGINLPIRNTEFADIVIERTKKIPLVIDTRNPLNNEMQSIRDQAKTYFERNQNNRQTVKEIVCDNLAVMLQDSEVSNIPLKPENSRYFVDFKIDKPTEKHLKSWSVLIINKYHSRLIAVSDQELAVQDMAKKVKNLELQEYILAGFRVMYGYEHLEVS